jgi:hypothetical protein
MKRKQRRLLAFKLAKREIKRLGAPRHQLKKFVKMYMDDILNQPDKYADEQ